MTTYFNNAFNCAPLHIDPQESPEILNDQIYIVIQEIYPEFLVANNNKHNKKLLDIKQLGGGLSNFLYVVRKGGSTSAGADEDGENYNHDASYDDDEKKVECSSSCNTTCTSILIRINTENDSIHNDEKKEDNNEEKEGGGEEVTTLVNRNVENRIFAWLSSQHKAPLYYGRFQNGRIEEFYDGYRPLSCHEMKLPKFTKAIASEMSNFHKCKLPYDVLPYNQKDVKVNGGEVWERIDSWINLVKDQGTDDVEIINLVHMLEKEWQWLKCQLQTPQMTFDDNNDDDGRLSIKELATLFSREVVFTHMDCQSLNILTPMTTEVNDIDDDVTSTTNVEPEEMTVPIRLIDFEYAGLNPRAADIANTFCEYCDMNNFAADYETEYPSIEEQNLFLKSYIQQQHDHSIVEKMLNREQEVVDCELAVWDTFLEHVRREIGMHTLVSHLGWAFWALAQAEMSTIEFDYVSYAKLRRDGYVFFKKKYYV